MLHILTAHNFTAIISSIKPTSNDSCRYNGQLFAIEYGLYRTHPFIEPEKYVGVVGDVDIDGYDVIKGIDDCKRVFDIVTPAGDTDDGDSVTELLTPDD